jgi:hypothetical protein
MDFFNDLFGSEMDELKSRTKVIPLPNHKLKRILDRRRNKELLDDRGLDRAEMSSAPHEERLSDLKAFCKSSR